jgi:hypothetical protein
LRCHDDVRSAVAAGGEPHVRPCSFHQRYEAVNGPLVEWLASLPAEYERLKTRAAAGAVATGGFDEAAPSPSAPRRRR